MRKLIAALGLLLPCFGAVAQQPLSAEAAKTLLRQQAIHLPLSDQDLSEGIVSAAYTQQPGNYAMVYLHQAVAGIEVYNRILSVHVRPGFTRAAGSFLPKATGLAQPANGMPKTTPAQALTAMLGLLQVNAGGTPELLSVADNNHKFFFDKGQFAWDKVQVKLQWNQPAGQSTLRLCWEVTLPLDKESHLYQWALDAETLEPLRKDDLTVSCQVAEHAHGVLENKTEAEIEALVKPYLSIQQTQQTSNTTGSQYFISPFPAESPLHAGGALALRTDPWLLSPAGHNATSLQWHSNGTTVYPISRGNNVYAQEDRDNLNSTFGQAASSSTSLPALTFNAAVNFDNQPTTVSNQQGAIINLFYWNNILHDISYLYGFHEAAGNFQVNNQGRGGLGNDAVNADAQDAGGTNNANMSTPSDGSSPRMQMYLWSANWARIMKINSPTEAITTVFALEGNLSTASRFLTTGAKTANLVIYEDAVNGNNSQACLPASNAAALAGKIALIQGSLTNCSYADKVLAAQSAGAIAAVIISSTNTLSTMTGTNSAILIPSVMIANQTGGQLRSRMLTGQTINVTLNAVQIDGDYDNGVIAHEYTHGISNRFTGGPAASSCLGNAEQMGEGWSDFYSLMTCTNWAATTLSDMNTARPIGNYASGRDIATGTGIRTYPYTPNMNTNPWTYNSVAGTNGAVHTIGAIWCTMLWDMTWKLIEMDGINPNMMNPMANGGNSVALRLVNEGMRLQPCSPGFVDGRNAILRADTLLYNGKYSCAIWQAFARRGLGWSASQGSSSSHTDGVAANDLPQGALVRKIAMAGSVSQLQEMDYQLKLRCQCSPISGYALVDTLATNLTYVSGGSYNAANRTVTFANISLNASDSATYTLRVRANAGSFQPAVNHVNETVTSPTIPANYVLNSTTGVNWTVSTSQSSSAPYSFFASNRSVEEEKSMAISQQFAVNRYTTLSFKHSFNTEAGYDGGLVEITNDNGNTWLDAAPYMVQNGYNTLMSSQSIFSLANRSAFSGNSGGFITTTLDLSSFAGQNLRFRFFFGSDAGIGGTGWYVDDVQLTSESALRNVAYVRNTNGSLTNSSTAITPINGFALPVVWQRFSAEKQQQAALLSWTTSMEQNTLRFVVERSAPGGAFEAIGTKAAAGNSQQPTDYRFVDANPFAGTNLYRIRQEDLDGKVSYSEVRSLDFAKAVLATVQPNPAKDRVVLQWPAWRSGADAQARLINAQGQVVAQMVVRAATSTLVLPVGLAAGNYQLQLVQMGEPAQQLPLLIQR